METNELYEAVSRHMDILKDGTEKAQVKAFQEGVCDSLNNLSNGYKWKTEYKIPNGIVGDSVDIFGQKNGNKDWIIEIDASRADQVAKKIVSRFALYGLNDPIQYVAIIYPGTENMPEEQCIKYLKYGNDIIKKLNEKSSVVGIFVHPDSGIMNYFPQ